MPKKVTVESLCRTIGATQYDITTEMSLQRGIGAALYSAGIAHLREVFLDSVNRIDFMVGSIGVEVKIGGGKSALLRQLMRYARSKEVSALLVVTTVPRLASIPSEINSKPLMALVLSACLV